MSKLTLSEIAKTREKVLQEIKKTVQESVVFDTFFKETYIHEIINNKIIITSTNDFAISVINNKYIDLIKDCVDRVTESNYEIEVTKISEKNTKIETKNNFSTQTKYFLNSIIEPKFTFDNFVVGTSNKEAQQGALAVALNPAEMFNPFYIYSPSGLGKTHLLNAIGNFIKQNTPHIKVIYIHTSEFIDEFMRFVKNPDDDDSLASYLKSFDVLLFDDIQLLARKKETQDYFFKILDNLIRNRKQIVLTSDRSAKELSDIQDRIRTRFYSGLSLSIDKPTTETCEEILKTKILSRGLSLDMFDDEVIHFLASKFKNNVRELEGAFLRLLFYSSLDKTKSKIDIDLTLQALQPIVNVSGAKEQLSEKYIIDIVAQYYNISYSQITGKLKTGQIAFARHIAIYLIRKILNIPYKSIGITFSNRDHSTIMHSIEKVEKMIQNDDNSKNVVEELTKKIKKNV